MNQLDRERKQDILYETAQTHEHFICIYIFLYQFSIQITTYFHTIQQMANRVWTVSGDHLGQRQHGHPMGRPEGPSSEGLQRAHGLDQRLGCSPFFGPFFFECQTSYGVFSLKNQSKSDA